jgi:hypothetical protein
MVAVGIQQHTRQAREQSRYEKTNAAAPKKKAGARDPQPAQARYEPRQRSAGLAEKTLGH